MKNELEYKQILNKIKKYKEYIFLFIVVCALCLLVLYSSPLYKGLPDIDSSVFQVMGKGMLENKIMYKELFDHKGPIVYIINSLAFLVSLAIPSTPTLYDQCIKPNLRPKCTILNSTKNIIGPNILP